MSINFNTINAMIEEKSREYERTLNLIGRCRSELNRLESHKCEVEGSLKTLCELRDNNFNTESDKCCDEESCDNCDSESSSCTDKEGEDTDETDNGSETEADSNKTTDN